LSRPSSRIVAGTATTRTTVASMRTAAARPNPIALKASSRLPVKAANTTTMISAADVTVRPVRSSPRVTARALEPVRSHSSRIRVIRKTS
jgi:hypothetical protein